MYREKIAKLRDLLKDTETRDPEIVKKEAKEFLKTIDAQELIMAEQMLMSEGIRPESLSNLCAAHLELLQGELNSVKDSLEDGHPVKVLILEHEEILKFLNRLDKVRMQVANAEGYFDLSSELKAELKEISHLLLETEKHHQREEDVLFPAAEAGGLYGPTKIMEVEHTQLRELKAFIDKFANSLSEENFTEFKADFLFKSLKLSQNLRDHIFKENTILYPAALRVIPQSEWARIKNDSDVIGYCSFTPV